MRSLYDRCGICTSLDVGGVWERGIWIWSGLGGLSRIKSEYDGVFSFFWEICD